MNNTTFALDLGTTKFCLARSTDDESQDQPSQIERIPVEFVSVPAMGMHRGMLSDFTRAKACLKDLLERAEKKFGTDISKVTVGVAGSHISSQIVERSLTVDGEPIDEETLERLDSLVAGHTRNPGREVVHNVPISFRIDDRPSVKNPIGFSGRSLSGRYLVIEADRDYLTDIISACNQCGLEVTSLVAEPYASALAITTEERRELGVVICDIGGGTTDGIVYKGGHPTAVFTVNIGGKVMTKDLSIGLSISLEEAERIKKRFGLCALTLPKSEWESADHTEVVTDIDGNLRRVTPSTVYRILAPRIHELGRLIKKELDQRKLDSPQKILLTGGGSQVANLTGYLQTSYFADVVSAVPRIDCHDISGPTAVANPTSIYATVAGLIYLEGEKQNKEAENKKSNWVNHHLSSFLGWLKELR